MIKIKLFNKEKLETQEGRDLSDREVGQLEGAVLGVIVVTSLLAVFFLSLIYV